MCAGSALVRGFFFLWRCRLFFLCVLYSFYGFDLSRRVSHRVNTALPFSITDRL